MEKKRKLDESDTHVNSENGPIKLYDGLENCEKFFNHLDEQLNIFLNNEKRLKMPEEFCLFNKFEKFKGNLDQFGLDDNIKNIISDDLKKILDIKPSATKLDHFEKLSFSDIDFDPPNIPFNITLEEPGHIYTVDKIDGKQKNVSVSALIDKLFGKFDVNEVAKKNIYFTINNHFLKSANGNTENAISNLKEEYKKRGDQSRNTGTHVHAIIENFFNNKINIIENEFKLKNKIFSKSSNKIKLLERFFKKRPEPHITQFFKMEQHIREYLIPFETEKRLFFNFNDTLNICGSTDMVFVDAKNEKVLFDWKIMDPKKFIYRNKAHGIKLFKDFQMTTLSKYTVQMNIYRFIMLNEPYSYKMSEKGMYLGLLQPDYFEIISIPILHTETVKFLLTVLSTN